MKNKAGILFSILLLFFPQLFSQRITESLNHHWNFVRMDEDDPSGNLPQIVDLPHTWNALDMLDDKEGYYRGKGIYTKTFTTSERHKGKKLFLYFEGVNQEARVFINNQLAGIHKGGYTGFCFEITQYISSGENIIRVEADNRYDPEVPPVGGDLGHFGGIYRDVWLVAVNSTHFDMEFYGSSGIFLQGLNITPTSFDLKVTARVVSPAGTLTLQHKIFSPEGELIGESKETLHSETMISSTVKSIISNLREPVFWGPDNPALYKVESLLMDKKTGEVLDQVTQKTGLRTIALDKQKGIIVNGKPLFIRGIGMHQDYYRKGYATHKDILKEDILRARDAGANLVRSHYPLSSATYDMCDNHGMFVWAKIPIMDKIEHSPEFMENAKTMMMEMVLQNLNRPSVILWGYACEVFGDMDWYWNKPRDPEKERENLVLTREFSLEFERFVRNLDPTRLTANDFHTDPTPGFYLKTGLTDINMLNGWNIYQGWYHNNLDSLESSLLEFHNYNPDKPFIIAEYGAGSDPRIHTYQPTIFDFSIEYQNIFHEHYLEKLPQLDFVKGMSMWTLFDFQADGRADAVSHVNSKGLFTSDRKPKDAFYLYKCNWNPEPQVYITGKDWNMRIETTESRSVIRPVKIYTNLLEAELIHNGRSLGVKPALDHKIIWDVNFVDGQNTLEVAGLINGNLIKDHAIIHMDFYRPGLPEMKTAGSELSINVGQSRTFFHDPVKQDSWMPDRRYIPGFFGHLNGEFQTHWPGMKAWEGIREGISHNIFGSEEDPVFQTFLEGVREYKIDLPSGQYELSLLFAEPFPGTERIMKIFVNGERCIEDLNLAASYGDYRAVILKYVIPVAEKGLNIQLEAVKGKTLLNGIKITRL